MKSQFDAPPRSFELEIGPAFASGANRREIKVGVRVRIASRGFFFLFISLAVTARVTGGSAWASTDACPGNKCAGDEFAYLRSAHQGSWQYAIQADTATQRS